MLRDPFVEVTANFKMVAAVDSAEFQVLNVCHVVGLLPQLCTLRLAVDARRILDIAELELGLGNPNHAIVYEHTQDEHECAE